MCRVVQDIRILKFYLSWQKYFGTIIFCRMSQDVGKFRCRIAQVPLYMCMWKHYMKCRSWLRTGKYMWQLVWYNYMDCEHPTKNYGPKVFLSTKIKLEYSDILFNPTHFPDPKVFLSTKIKPEYSNILYNPTHFPGPLVCRIGQVPLYLPVPTLLLCCHILHVICTVDLTDQ
jgi:hypothetical protein